MMRRMRKTIFAALLLLIAALPVLGQASTPEKRRWAVDTTRWLENNPLDRESKQRAGELLQWWTEVPDLTLSICPLMLEAKNKKIGPTVVTQALFSTGAYLIEHPQASRLEQSFAGVQGALRAYRNALAADPKMRDKFLDELVQADNDGKLLATYVKPAIDKCEADEKAKR